MSAFPSDTLKTSSSPGLIDSNGVLNTFSEFTSLALVELLTIPFAFGMLFLLIGTVSLKVKFLLFQIKYSTFFRKKIEN